MKMFLIDDFFGELEMGVAFAEDAGDGELGMSIVLQRIQSLSGDYAH